MALCCTNGKCGREKCYYINTGLCHRTHSVVVSYQQNKHEIRGVINSICLQCQVGIFQREEILKWKRKDVNAECILIRPLIENVVVTAYSM